MEEQAENDFLFISVKKQKHGGCFNEDIDFVAAG